MADQTLANRRIAILATDGFESVELLDVRAALDAAGAVTHVIAPQGKPVTDDARAIRALEFPDWGADLPVDRWLSEARVEDYDALYLPGGIINPDLLRLVPEAIAFVRAMHDAGRPIGSMCHGPWLLISAGVVQGRRVAAWPSLRDDLRNAGATYVDEAVVRDGPFVTARTPEDIPRLNPALIEHFAVTAEAAAE